jgi:hypothetical protein
VDGWLRGEGCDGWGCEVRGLIGRVFRCATIHCTLVSAGQGQLMRVEPTAEPGLNWRAAWPRGRCPSPIYSSPRCSLPAWSAAGALAEHERTMLPAPRNALPQNQHPRAREPSRTHDSPRADLRGLTETAQSGTSPSFLMRSNLPRSLHDPTRRGRVSSGAAIANQPSPSKPPALAPHLRGRSDVIMLTRVPDRLRSGPPVATSGEARHARGVTL